MIRWLLPLLVFLAGCDTSTPLPSKCREVGVAVQDNDTVTGRIVERNVVDYAHMGELRGRCGVPFTTQLIQGCAIPVNEGEYILWYVDEVNVRIHNECHALFEEKRHT